MKRRIVLVDLYWTRDKDPRVPLGHASLLASLRARIDLDVRSLVFAVNTGRLAPDAVVAAILTEVGGLARDEVDVALSAYVWSESLVHAIVARLRRAGFEGRIVLGGPQISYADATMGLERLYPGVDVFIRGYAENALADVASSPRRRDVSGVHWAGADDRAQQAAVDLDALPSPWLTSTLSLDGQRFIRWETQRGCPFRCSFCQHRESGVRLRRRSLALSRVDAEIDLFCRSGVDDIAVLDPVFNASPRATEVLRRFVERGYRGRLSLQCRAESIDEPFVEAAAQLDVRLEFGLQTVHDGEGRAIERRNDLARVDRSLRAVRDRGIHHEVSLIFALPTQTLASFEASVAWCLEREVPVIKAFPLMLLRGTALDRTRDRWALRESDAPMPMVVASSSFTEGEWQKMAALSEALRRTEGHHPRSLRELQRLASTLDPDRARWSPADFEEVA
ncbi:MAG: B12-binding domain-containing radical SAM protein [Polyangiales bacterium]